MNFNIDEFKKKLKGLPKDDKLDAIQQEINNLRFQDSHIPGKGLTPAEIERFKKNPPPKLSDEQIKKIEIQRQEHKAKKEKEHNERETKIQALESFQSEIENNVEAYASQTRRKELIPFMYDRDLNWYFNSKNIPAQQKLVLPTYDFFNEAEGKEIFEPLDFLNLLYKQYKDLQINKDKPFDVLKNLKSIPITDRERHSLYGFILKWFGGYPVSNLDAQCDIVVKLIEREFLKYSEDIPEKKLCTNDPIIQKQFKELAAHISAEMKGVKVIVPNDSDIQTKYNFSGSQYINKVVVDFENLPDYIIQQGIIRRFENERMYKDAEYIEWKKRLLTFLQSIPEDYRLKTLTKGIEYGNIVYKYHLNNECTNTSNCPLNQSWQRRIALAKDLLKELKPDNHTKQNDYTIYDKTSKSAFIIHGHETTKKLEVARFVENDLKHQAIILHEQPSKGRTIIEKFENYSNVDLAIALWTADDCGRMKTSEVLNKRARQNVVFETGFFIGKIGRENVIVLYEQGVEIPSDYSGVIFIPLDGNWKNDLRKEINAIK